MRCDRTSQSVTFDSTHVVSVQEVASKDTTCVDAHIRLYAASDVIRIKKRTARRAQTARTDSNERRARSARSGANAGRGPSESELMETVSRRRFLKISATTFGAAAVATQWEPLTQLANAADAARQGRDDDPDLLRHLLLEVRRHRLRARRQALEDRGQPGGPAEPRPPLPARHRRRRRALRPRPPADAADPRAASAARRSGRR